MSPIAVKTVALPEGFTVQHIIEAFETVPRGQYDSADGTRPVVCKLYRDGDTYSLQRHSMDSAENMTFAPSEDDRLFVEDVEYSSLVIMSGSDYDGLITGGYEDFRSAVIHKVTRFAQRFEEHLKAL